MFATILEWIWLGNGRAALTVIERIPREFLEEFIQIQPKGYMKGRALKTDGRDAAAQAEWRQAISVLDARLALEPNRAPLLSIRAELLALTGQSEEGDRLWVLLRDLPPEPLANAEFFRAKFLVAAGRTEEAIRTVLQNEFVLRGRTYFRLDPLFAEVRKDQRVQGLITQWEKELQAMRSLGTSTSRHADTSSASNAKPRTQNAETSRPAADANSVAVLAFSNLSEDKGNEYFSDGISEELLNVLARIPGLKVSARTSAFYFKGKQVPISEIAGKLGVAYVVDGSVQKAGNRVRIKAQLVKAVDGFQVWSENFDRELKDIFVLQDEIAGLIAQRLQLKLGVVAPAAVVNTNALQLYLEARGLWNARDPKALDHMEDLLSQVLRLEPQFAPAEAALAFVWVTRALSAAQAVRHIPKEIGLAEAHARRALERDPNLAEALEARGTAAWLRGRLTESEESLRRAVDSNGSYARGWNRLGWLLERQGRLDEALECFLRARELDPLAPPMLDGLGRIRNQLGQPAETVALHEQAQPVVSPFLWSNVGVAHMLVGRTDEALDVARKVLAVPSDAFPDSRTRVALHGVTAWVLAEVGAREEAEALIQRTLAEPEPLRWAAGLPLLAMGRADEAYPLLRETPQHLVVWFWLVTARRPALAHDPRFLQLLDELGATQAFRLVDARPERPRAPKEARR
jgi:TolB-like protein